MVSLNVAQDVLIDFDTRHDVFMSFIESGALGEKKWQTFDV